MQNKYFDFIRGNFGFGCMRLPMLGEEVDLEQVKKMVDHFLSQGFNYFDTAHGYLGGKSELALKECLTSRYPREAYILTDKLSGYLFKTTEEIRPLFRRQLEACGVDYFDFYLMHAQDRNGYPRFKELKAYETVLELMEEGKIRHFGISFHDKAALLDQILTENPRIEIVQIQLNYVDFEDPSVESRKCLEVCRKHGKPAIIMEPVKGGSLANLPEEAAGVLAGLGGGSSASYAIRFAASQEGVAMVLSGMSDLAMMEENCGFMKDFRPLNAEEQAAVDKVCRIIRDLGAIPCTACRYCTEVCPQKISIPDLFACLNSKKVFNNFNAFFYYMIHTGNGNAAKDCVECGACENICPQHLEIRKLMKEVSENFDKK